MSRLSLLLAFMFSFSINAEHMSPLEINEIESVCQQSTPSCLAILEVGLNDSKAYSTQWFRLKQLRLNALFDLQKLKPLQQEVNYWLSLDESKQVKMPPNFAVYIYIYNAKLIRKVNQDKKSNEEVSLYLNKAINLLSDINDKLPSPRRLIEIANLQISMQDYEQAKTTLLDLDKKFEHRYHPNFKQELYANLGHIAYYQNDHEMHINYRQQSLTWTLETDNDQQKSVAHLNLAVAYQKNQQYSNAEKHYKTSYQFSKIAQDDRGMESAQLRILEVTLLQGKTTQANRIFDEMPVDYYDQISAPHNKALYNELKSALNKAN